MFQFLNKNFPDNQQLLGSTRNNIGNLFRSQNKFKQAEQHLREALDYRKMKTTQNYQLTGVSLNDLGNLFIKQN